LEVAEAASALFEGGFDDERRVVGAGVVVSAFIELGDEELTDVKVVPERFHDGVEAGGIAPEDAGVEEGGEDFFAEARDVGGGEEGVTDLDAEGGGNVGLGVVEEAADLIFEFGIGGGDGEESDVEVALGAELASTESAGGDDGELKGVSDFGLKVVAETDDGFVEDSGVTLAPGFSGGLAPEGVHEGGSLGTEIVK